MPSFDVVSEVDAHELTNAVDQARRIIANRFDFKGVQAVYELTKEQIILKAEADFQIQQMQEILFEAFVKRNLDNQCLDYQEATVVGKEVKLQATIKQGIDKDTARKLIKLIKSSKVKVQSAIQGEQLRVTGKKRDDLQKIITVLRQESLDVPLQYTNFRD